MLYCTYPFFNTQEKIIDWRGGWGLAFHVEEFTQMLFLRFANMKKFSVKGTV